MADSGNSQQTDSPSQPEKPSWVARGIGAIKSHLEKRRAEKKQQTVADRAPRSAARAPWVIAALTVAPIFVSVSQFIIYKGQLDEMRATREGGDKSTVDQLNIMLG